MAAIVLLVCFFFLNLFALNGENEVPKQQQSASGKTVPTSLHENHKK